MKSDKSNCHLLSEALFAKADKISKDSQKCLNGKLQEADEKTYRYKILNRVSKNTAKKLVQLSIDAEGCQPVPDAGILALSKATICLALV